nr:DUF1673 family protein [uncultured Methanoregula sp.]
MPSQERYYLKDAILEQIQKLMGWCPNARMHQVCRTAPAEQTIISEPGGGGTPALSFGRMNRYRTRAFAFALCMTGVSISLFATATGDRLAMLATGLALAAILYCGDALRYRDLFRQVKEAGIVKERDWKEISIVRLLPVIGAAILLAFVGAVLLGLVPGLSMLAVNGFLAGFAAIGWLHLLTIITWEQQSGIPLYTDGKQIYRRAA